MGTFMHVISGHRNFYACYFRLQGTFMHVSSGPPGTFMHVISGPREPFMHVSSGPREPLCMLFIAPWKLYALCMLFPPLGTFHVTYFRPQDPMHVISSPLGTFMRVISLLGNFYACYFPPRGACMHVISPPWCINFHRFSSYFQ